MTDKMMEFAVSVVNTVLLTGNIYWMWMYRKSSGDNLLVKTLTEQNEGKNLIIKDLRDEVHSFKLQYHNLLIKYEKMKTELETLKKVAINEK